MASSSSPQPPSHLASLLQGLSSGAPSPSLTSPSAGQGDVNSLLRMLNGGGPPATQARSPPAMSPASPASPPSNGAFSLLDLLNQRPGDRSGMPLSPSHSIDDGARPEVLVARSDVSQTGSPGGRLGGTSLLEMLMQGGLPTGPPPSNSSPAQSQRDLHREAPSPPPATSMNPLLMAQQQVPTSAAAPSPVIDTGFTSPSPPPSECMALRIEPQTTVAIQSANGSDEHDLMVKPSAPEPARPQPNPSKFNFVSPFDAAFGPPTGKRSKSVQPSTSSASATATAGSQSPAPTSTAGPVPRSTSSHAILPAGAKPESTPPTVTSVPSTARASSPLSPARSRASNVGTSAPAISSPLGHSRTGSGSLRLKKGDVFPSGKWGAKDLRKSGRATGTGVPDRQRFAPVDVSRPNLETLVADESAMSKRPISIIRSDNIFAPGRTVEGTTFIAYAMNKGRVRLIDEASGARALLKLPTEWYHRDSQVVDLAANGGLVAVITTDGGLVLWRVPTSWSNDDPECELCYASAPSDDENARLALVRWISTSRLAVSSATAVYLLDVEQLSGGWPRSHPGNLEDIAREPFACRISGVSIVDFAVHPAPSSTGATQVAIISTDGSFSMHLVDTAFTVDDYWRGHVTGGIPSSISLLDSDLLLLGANKGTVLRLYSLSADTSGGPDFSQPLDEVRFEAPDATPMFGKVEHDRRRDLVWVSNTARCSLYALRLDRNDVAGAAFAKIVEFPLEDPLTSFVFKAADFDAFTLSPNGVDMLTFAGDVVDQLLQPCSATPAVNGQQRVGPELEAINMATPNATEAKAAAAQTDAPPSATPPALVKTAIPADEAIGTAVLREIAKAEESIVRRFTTSLQLQSDKLETADLRRQEKIFAVLSQELGANQSSLVTDAVRSELQASVLPALSTVIRAEVRSVIQQEISRGVAEAINSRTVFLSVDKAVKDLVTKTLIPSYNNATADMGAALSREVREDMINIRKEVVREQSGALVETNDLLAEMTSHIQALAKQVTELQSTVVGLQQQVVAIPQHPRQTSPASSPVKEPSYPHPSHHVNQPQHASSHSHTQAHQPFSSAPFGNPPMRSPLIQTMPIHPASLAYPQPVGPTPSFSVSSPHQHSSSAPFAQPPPPPPAAPGPDWGDVFTEAFLSADPSALASLTRRIGPHLDVVLPDVPLGGRQLAPDQRGPLSQAVLLTTIHKFTESLPRASAHTPDFASAIVVIARSSRLLDTADPTIVPYAHRVISQVLPALSRTEDALVQAAGRPASASAMSERTRTFFVDSLRAIRGDLTAKNR